MYRVQTLRALTTKLAFIMLVIALAGLMGSAQAQGGASDGDAGLISLNVYDVELTKVVRMLMSSSNENIVIADQSKMQNKVSVALNDMPFEKALKRVAQSAGCSVHRDEDGVYIIGAPEPQATSNTVPLVDGTSPVQSDMRAPSGYEARRITRVESIKLYNTSPTDMMWYLGLYEYNGLKSTMQETKRFTPGVQRERPNGETEAVFSPARPSNLTPPTNDGLHVDPAYSGRATIPGGEAGQMMAGGPSGGGPGYAVGAGASRFPATAPGTAPGAAPGAASGTTNKSSLLPDGIDYIMPYPLDNSLIVRGDDEGISELKEMIAKFDIAPKQILIKAEFVEISTSAAKTLGINWSLDRLGTSLSTEFNTPGNITLGYANGNVMASLKAQLSESKGKLINAPLVRTMNNVPGVIRFSTIVPYLSSEIIYNSQGNPSTITIPEFLDISSELLVLPRVNNADNTITCFIQPTISDSPGSVDTPNGKIPITTQQQVVTTGRVPNGETIVLGGLIRKSDNVNVNKIPLLGDIPLIGTLFRSMNKDIDDKELLIFLTPTIVPEKSAAGAGVGVMP
jgi:general secretion pathway protein D